MRDYTSSLKLILITFLSIIFLLFFAKSNVLAVLTCGPYTWNTNDCDYIDYTKCICYKAGMACIGTSPSACISSMTTGCQGMGYNGCTGYTEGGGSSGQFCCSNVPCNSGITCGDTCSAPTNTCSVDNGTKSCNYTNYQYYDKTTGPVSPNICIVTPAPSQSCTIDNCSDGKSCVEGVCVVPTSIPPTNTPIPVPTDTPIPVPTNTPTPIPTVPPTPTSIPAALLIEGTVFDTYNNPVSSIVNARSGAKVWTNINGEGGYYRTSRTWLNGETVTVGVAPLNTDCVSASQNITMPSTDTTANFTVPCTVTIQGHYVDKDGNWIPFDGSTPNKTVTISGGALSSPVTATNNVGGDATFWKVTNLPPSDTDYTVTASNLAGYAISSSPCTNCTSHPVPYTSGNPTAVNLLTAGNYADIYFKYTPSPATPTPTLPPGVPTPTPVRYRSTTQERCNAAGTGWVTEYSDVCVAATSCAAPVATSTPTPTTAAVAATPTPTTAPVATPTPTTAAVAATPTPTTAPGVATPTPVPVICSPGTVRYVCTATSC